MRKHGFFANLKKCHLYKNKVSFLGYILSVQRMQMEDKIIEVVRNWLEPKLIRDIYVFLSFANFYQCFIQSFSKIAGPFILMLKITQLVKNLSLLIAGNTKIGSIRDGDDDETVKKSFLISKNLIKTVGYLTPQTRLIFTQLRKTLFQASIL